MTAWQTHVPLPLTRAGPPTTARSSWTCLPFLRHDFSSGGLASLSHCCSPQFLACIHDEYCLIHSSNIDPALPLPQDHILDLVEPAFHGKRQTMVLKFVCSQNHGRSFKNICLSVSGSQSQWTKPNFLGIRFGHQDFLIDFQVILICIRVANYCNRLINATSKLEFLDDGCCDKNEARECGRWLRAALEWIFGENVSGWLLGRRPEW